MKNIFEFLVAIGLMISSPSGPAAAAISMCGSKPTYILSFAIDSVCVDGMTVTDGITENTQLFGLKGWTMAARSGSDNSDNLLSFSLGPVNGTQSGNLSVLNLGKFDNIIVALQAGTGYTAFLLGDELAGSWWTRKELTHASIYYSGQANIETLPQVPIPAAGFLLAGAVSGLFALGWRKI